VAFTTADLCDEYPHLVRVAQPVFRDFGARTTFTGPIETLKVFEDNGLVRQVLATDGKGRVLVVDGGGSLRCALLGGGLASLAQANNWSGVLVNGGVRDSAELSQIAVGIRALNTAPMRSGKQGMGETGTTVTFAGVDFVPQQFLYADKDGILLAARNLLA
jgi:regulator of ribonuclease activity A